MLYICKNNFMETIQEIQNELLEAFGLCNGWVEKYELILHYGKNHKHQLTDQSKTIIKGCQSNVWLETRISFGKIIIFGHSDSLLVNGIIAILIKMYSNQHPSAIRKSDTDFLNKIGISQHLGKNRGNGLTAIHERIKQLADDH